MATYYVGPGGNNGSAGTSWATRYLTLSGIEAKPVAAGDTVYVGPGTYRETLTLGVSGTAGNVITYIGDYLGTNTDGVGGIIRITGSDNDQTAARANCISNTSPYNYRTFTGFTMDTTSGVLFSAGNGADHNILQQCVFVVGGNTGVQINGAATITNNTIQNCVFFGNRNQTSLLLGYATSQINNSNNLIQNCILLGGTNSILLRRTGGTTVKNCSFLFQAATGGGEGAVFSDTALTGGQTITVNNNVFYSCASGLTGQTGNADITEDYNTFYANIVNRTNVNTGAHSVTYPPLLDPRPWLQMLFAPAASQLVSPFDLASYSQLVNLAGTSPSSTDLRGTAIQGAQREWGALEYDSRLKLKGKHTTTRYRTGAGAT